MVGPDDETQVMPVPDTAKNAFEIVKSLERIQSLCLDTLHRCASMLRTYIVAEVQKKDAQLAKQVVKSSAGIEAAFNRGLVDARFIDEALEYYLKIALLYLKDNKTKKFVYDLVHAKPQPKGLLQDYVDIYRLAQRGIDKATKPPVVSEVCTDIDAYTKLIEGKIGRLTVPKGISIGTLEKFNNLAAIRNIASQTKKLTR